MDNIIFAITPTEAVKIINHTLGINFRELESKYRRREALKETKSALYDDQEYAIYLKASRVYKELMEINYPTHYECIGQAVYTHKHPFFVDRKIVLKFIICTGDMRRPYLWHYTGYDITTSVVQTAE